MTQTFPTLNEINKSFFYLMFCILLLTPNCYAELNLPDLGSPDLKEYDTETEQALGRAFTSALHTHFRLIQDPEILSYIRRIGDKIVGQTGVKREFSFYVIDNPEVNAFAGPNGVIGIHSGLIDAVQTEDELASVIAHEVAHITQKHLSRTFEYQKDASLSSLATLIAALLIGTQDPGAGIATYLGGTSLNMQQALSHSRIHEHEADYIGIQYLYKSQYNPYAMGKFFGRLSKQYQLNEFKTPEILLTHPVTEKRLAQADDRAATFPSFIQTTTTPSELNQIKMRLALHEGRLSQIATRSLTNTDGCYLNALLKTKWKINNNEKLTETSCDLTKITKSDRLVSLILAQNNGHDNLQLQAFESLRAFYPKDFSILYRQAEAMQAKGAYHDAISLLENNLEQYTSKFLLYQKLAELYGQLDSSIEMNFYLAKANFEIGNYPKTHYLLKQIPEQGTQNQQKIITQSKILLTQIEIQLKKQKETDK